MSIITQCPSCGKKLKAPDENAGKQARCPQCKKPFVIKAVAKATRSGAAVRSKSKPQPTARPQPRPQPQTQEPRFPDQWYVQTGEGAEYGPVTKAELEQWITEDRLDSECQILQDGWDQWKWAEDVFLQLGGGEEENPFSGIGGGSNIGGGDSFVVAGGGESNPYASPSSSGVSAADGNLASSRIVRAMDGARPWLMLFAVLAFIGSAGGLVGVIMSFVAMRASVGAGCVLLLMSLFTTCMYGFIGYLLLTYSKCSGAFVRSRNISELERALQAAKAFWKTVGLLTVISIALNLAGGMVIYFVFWAAFGELSATP
ncbi:MAG: hypothetical protein VB875_06205 [Pirellulales bacterium]